MALATQTDVEAVLGRVLTTDEATFIDLQLAMASAFVELEIGQTLEVVTGDVVTVTPDPYGNVRLPQLPVTAVSSVVLGGETLDAASYSFTRQGVLHRLVEEEPTSCYGAWTSPVTVTYDHGFATVPVALSMVVAELAASRVAYAASGGSGAVKSAQVDDIHVTYDTGTASSSSGTFVLSDGHTRILARFRPPAPVINMVAQRI